MEMKNALKNKKLRYGSLSIVFIAAFVMLVIALNLILTSISSKVNLSVDLTKEELYTVGEETKAILGTLGDEFDITIYFLADRDRYERSKYSLMVRDLGEEYARVYPNNVRVVYKDINKDPTFVEKYKSQTQINISTSHLIIEGKYHHRVINLDAFFTMSEETGAYYSFNGELRYTSAMLQCSIEEPQVVTFTTEHGETISESLLDILYSAGFEFQFKDLSKEDIDERTRILIISNPLFDFLGYEGENTGEKTEIEKIADYVNKFKNLIVFVNSSTPSLPNLQEYLLEYWGIGYKPYHKINDMAHAVATGGNDGFSVVAQYAGSEGSSAANLHSVASSSGSGARTVFRNAVELFSDENKANAGVGIETVMKTFPTARSIYRNEDNEEVSTTGEFPLMLLSTNFNYGENNVKKFQYVLLVSSTSFASDTFLKDNKFGNNLLLFGAARTMSTEWVSPSIKTKPFIKEALVIEMGAANTLTWLVSGVFPLFVIIAGLVVFFKRRHL
ncbi:MAG: hypothetical protein CVU97_01860 [Firmicutes bacterium HGW-Firmicutes-21]|nr:MAG: hypothetical protein CVU97_01860 [Firmicutes bacterium HGW-Firmicutes-21]